MNEMVQISLETTEGELISKAYHLLTAISTMAESIERLDFSKDADLEADVLEYTNSIESLSEMAQTFLFRVNGEL